MDHGDHGGMDMGGKCAMSMLWNTQIIDTCIVFPQWHVRSHASFALSFLAIVALGVFYEWLRAFSRGVDRRVARALADGKGKGRVSPTPGAGFDVDEDAALLTGRPSFKSSLTNIPTPARALRATLYGATVFLSFFLMLVFMTYNAYLILAVVLGAAIGHYYLGGQMDVDSVLYGGAENKGMACH
ncbi:copper transporter [Phellopilus nigrolimitatus]|nr:copper transporter [Phellopilus nigrolimitatus]